VSRENDSLLTEELRGWIGRATPPRSLEPVTAPLIRRYVDATGDANPLWLDDEFARSAGYQGRVLPPMLVGWESFKNRRPEKESETDPDDLFKRLPFPENYTQSRNAGTEIEWLAAAYPGEFLTAQSRIVDIVAREGKGGLGIYVTQETEVRNEKKERVLCRRQTTVRLPGK
jgi:acyl dehydratase